MSGTAIFLIIVGALITALLIAVFIFLQELDRADRSDT